MTNIPLALQTMQEIIGGKKYFCESLSFYVLEVKNPLDRLKPNRHRYGMSLWSRVLRSQKL